MFNLFTNDKKQLVYTNEHIHQDIDKFLLLFYKNLDKLDIEVYTFIPSIKDLVNKINSDYIYIISTISDKNTLSDLNESLSSSDKKEQIANVEDFILKIEKNISEHIIKQYPNSVNIITETLTQSYFDYLEFKRFQINKFTENKNVELVFNYFGSMYRIKSLYKNVSLKKELSFNTINNKNLKIKERDSLVTMEDHLWQIINDFSQNKDIKDFTPELLSAITYNSRNLINMINNDYIIPAWGINPRNKLSVDECITNKYLPIFNVQDDVYIKWADWKKIKATVNKAFIVTTLEWLLSRHRWDIWNEPDNLWYSLSHFWNFIKLYDDDNLYKQYLVLSAPNFELFFDYINLNNKFYTQLLSWKGEIKKDLKEADIWTWKAKKEFDEILLQAIKRKATDIHLKFFDNSWLINFRTKTWVLVKYSNIDDLKLRRIIRMLVDDAKASAFNQWLPQDWEQHREIRDPKTEVKYDVDLRFWFSPGDEPRVYIRLWRVVSDWEEHKLSLIELWYKQEDLDIINWACENNSTWLILVTWPTGSWKTTLLYWILERQLPLRQEIHLLTAEDPIERQLEFPNVEQNSITKVRTSKVLLKSFLRQDPDWILVWETRDKELLSMVIDASQTGHLTFSTYHTNNTIETLERLSKMYSWDNVQNFAWARDSLLAIIRMIISVILVPKLCWNCKESIIKEDVFNRIKKKWFSDDRINNLIEDDWTFYKRNLNWCTSCELWYKWKQVITEIMNLSNEDIMKQVQKSDYSCVKTLFQDWMTYVNSWVIDVDTLAKNANK